MHTVERVNMTQASDEPLQLALEENDKAHAMVLSVKTAHAETMRELVFEQDSHEDTRCKLLAVQAELLALQETCKEQRTEFMNRYDGIHVDYMTLKCNYDAVAQDHATTIDKFTALQNVKQQLEMNIRQLQLQQQAHNAPMQRMVQDFHAQMLHIGHLQNQLHDAQLSIERLTYQVHEIREHVQDDLMHHNTKSCFHALRSARLQTKLNSKKQTLADRPADRPTDMGDRKTMLSQIAHLQTQNANLNIEVLTLHTQTIAKTRELEEMKSVFLHLYAQLDEDSMSSDTKERQQRLKQKAMLEGHAQGMRMVWVHMFVLKKRVEKQAAFNAGFQAFWRLRCATLHSNVESMRVYTVKLEKDVAGARHKMQLHERVCKSAIRVSTNAALDLNRELTAKCESMHHCYATSPAGSKALIVSTAACAPISAHRLPMQAPEKTAVQAEVEQLQERRAALLAIVDLLRELRVEIRDTLSVVKDSCTEVHVLIEDTRIVLQDEISEACANLFDMVAPIIGQHQIDMEVLTKHVTEMQVAVSEAQLAMHSQSIAFVLKINRFKHEAMSARRGAHAAAELAALVGRQMLIAANLETTQVRATADAARATHLQLMQRQKQTNNAEIAALTGKHAEDRDALKRAKELLEVKVQTDGDLDALIAQYGQLHESFKDCQREHGLCLDREIALGKALRQQGIIVTFTDTDNGLELTIMMQKR